MAARRAFFSVLFFWAGVTGSPAWACSVCFKDPDSAMTIGLGQGVFVMLGALGFVFAAFVKFFIATALRSRLSSALTVTE